MKELSEDKIGIYIHIPFCKKKCLYCDFVSSNQSSDIHEKYIKRLCEEIDKYDGIKSADTIFFGGGTPSSIDPRLIGIVMDKLCDKFNISLSECEITLEANPGTIFEDSARQYKSFGINRISMGLQSHSNAVLKMLGRIHTFEDYQKSLEILRKVGFDNINTDLMFALPSQNPDVWLKSIEIVSELTEHISAYSLIIEENTPFYDMYEKGELKPVDDETDRCMYHKAVELLDKKGFHRYEISNFAKKGFESRHNLKYWSCDKYIGFGTAASSYDGIKRFSNTPVLSEYLNGKTVSYSEALTENQKTEEFMFLGLRKTCGISVCEFEKRFGCGITEKYPIIDKFINDGFMIKNNDMLKLTDKGIDVCDSLFTEFML